MKNTTFAVGPSELYAAMPLLLQDVYESGILSESHRGTAFCKLVEETLALLHDKLNIPSDYSIVFTGSSTENWEVIAQSLTEHSSTHYYSGAFGEKWFDYAKKIHPDTVGIKFDCNEPVPFQTGILKERELLCFTQNETSNGTQINLNTLNAIREAYPLSLLAYDCTSSMAGIDLPWQLGDVWYASVQKCFGMPAGLGILVLSPDAVAKARLINERAHYNSLVSMLDMIAKFQTTFTPNVLAIALLNRVLVMIPNMKETEANLINRANSWYTFLEGHSSLVPLIDDNALRSITVMAVKAEGESLAWWKEKSKNAGVSIGAGYGVWKENTFRIANFPAISQRAIDTLQDVLKKPFHPAMLSS